MSFAIYSTNLTEDGELDMSLSAAPAVAAPAVAAPTPAVAAPAVAAPAAPTPAAPTPAAPATENEVTVDTIENLSNVKLDQIEVSPISHR